MKKIAIELQQMWRDKLGISMELRQVETQVFWGMQSRMDYDLTRSSWIGDYNDANTFLGMFITGDGNNETGWSNLRYDELVRAANEQSDLKKREKLFQQAETILVQDEPNQISGIWENVLDDHPLRSIRKIKSNP
jgi:oligopeptide transport system substrate-binding protein